MQIQLTHDEGIYIAELNGVLDEGIRDAFEDQLHPLIEERGNRLVLDLAEVPRITSSGLGLLVTLVARANTKGAKVVLAAVAPFVESVIGVTRLDQFFAIAPSIEAAINSITSSVAPSK